MFNSRSLWVIYGIHCYTSFRSHEQYLAAKYTCIHVYMCTRVINAMTSKVNNKKTVT